MAILAVTCAEMRLTRILQCIEYCNQENLQQQDLVSMEANPVLRDVKTERFPGCIIFSSFRCVCLYNQ